jgi:uncharacterized protein YndB with AHSA1/START domain
MPGDRIEREIRIDAPIDVVWAVVTEPEQMSQWLSDTADFQATPGAYGSVAWEKYGSYDLRVEEAERPSRFAFRWVYPPGSEPHETNSLLVEFTLTEEDGVTRLRLVESGFRFVKGGSETNLADHERGWDGHLARLVEYVGKAKAAAR